MRNIGKDCERVARDCFGVARCFLLVWGSKLSVCDDILETTIVEVRNEGSEGVRE